MSTDKPTSTGHSLAFSRWRDARIVWLLECHPVTAAMLVRLGWFPSRAKALRRLQKLVRRRRVRLVGTVCGEVGRPENVYCRWRPKADALLHEVELTRFCLALHAGQIRRGPQIQDVAVRPDAEVWINRDLYYLEWDCGTMSYAQIVRHRFPNYRDCKHLVLWVCSTAARRDGLRIRAAAIRHAALFATAADALASPHATVWHDHAGRLAALPRHGAGRPGEQPGKEQGGYSPPAGGGPAPAGTSMPPVFGPGAEVTRAAPDGAACTGPASPYGGRGPARDDNPPTRADT